MDNTLKGEKFMGNVVIILSEQKNPILKEAEIDEIQELKKNFLQQNLSLMEIGNDIIILFESNQNDFEKPILFLLDADEEVEVILGGDLLFLSGKINESGKPNFASLSPTQEEYVTSSLFLENNCSDNGDDFYFLFKPEKFEGYSTVDSYNTIEVDMDLPSY